MPNQVAGFYTTSQEYRPTASNHLYAYKYDADNMYLYIQFHNGATYKYLGIHKGLAEGLDKSESHGVFFWNSIRQRFPTINLGKKPLGYLAQVDNIQYELYPDLAKLDQIDAQ